MLRERTLLHLQDGRSKMDIQVSREEVLNTFARLDSPNEDLSERALGFSVLDLFRVCQLQAMTRSAGRIYTIRRAWVCLTWRFM